MSIISNTFARRTALLVIDLILLAVAWIASYLLRFDFSLPSYSPGWEWDYRTQAFLMLPWVIGLHLVFFYVFHLYRGMVRYVSTAELKAIILASAANVLIWAIFSEWVEGRESFLQLPVMDGAEGGYHVMRISRGVFPIYLLMSIFLTGGFRFSSRLWVESRLRAEEDAPATLIVGAGALAENALREIMRGETARFRPLCVVSTSAERIGSAIHGVRVRGTIKDIPDLLKKHEIKVVLIALDQDDPALLRAVIVHCQDAHVEFYIIPTMKDITSGRVEVRSTRRVELNDLLGREPVRLELPVEKNYLRDNVVLITGAGGSIGRELCRQVAMALPRRILLVGKGENSIYEIQQELLSEFRNTETSAIIADVRDEQAMFRLFEEQTPSVIFHAAAHKHVPLMEGEPEEALKNNVLGTAVVVWLADKFGAERFILISSDKAVRPTSVMGATKRLSEMVAFSIGRESKTVFQSVRFGNVLGSRGSVIPLFERQIAKGGPVTITHPDVTRYFMTIPEAVSLVIHSGIHNEPCSLFLLDMGEPVKILDIVRNLITLSGLKEGTDIEIKYCGLRPGEKLHEELLTKEEGAQRTEIGKVWVTKPRGVVPWEEMKGLLKELRQLAEDGAREEILKRLSEIIPDYHPAGMSEKTDAEALTGARERAEDALEVSLGSVRSILGILDDSKLLQGDLFGEDTPLTAGSAAVAPEENPEEERTEDVPDLFREWESEIESGSDECLTSEAAGGEDNGPETGDKFPVSGAMSERPSHIIRQEDDLMTATSSPRPQTAGQDGQTSVVSCVFLALLEGVPAGLKRDFFDDLASKIDASSTLIVSGAEKDELPGTLRDRCTLLDPEIKSVPERWNAAIRACPPGSVLIAVGPTIRLSENFVESIRNEAAKDSAALIFYSNYISKKGDKSKEELLHDHEGCPHERFDFGQLIAYRADAVREAGYFDESLQHAWEYDMHLKLMEKGHFQRIAQPIYTAVEPAEEETKSGALYSPGRGKLGGFSYVFYPEDVEREVTGAFEKALKRWGAWLDHDTVPVPTPRQQTPVMGSVVIPVLNRRRFIGNAIEKVLEGTYKNIEVIVIDNGSTDGTQDVVQEIASRDSRVRLLKGTGSSIASALNDGIRAARGKYICQLDSDDEYVPTTLEKMISHLESHPKCGLAISYYRLIEEGGAIIHEVAPITHSGYTRNQILRRDGAGALRVFPKAVLEEFGLYDEKNYGNFGEDYDMVLKTGEKYDVDRVHEVLYHYRRHGDNTDVIRDPEMKYKNKNNARQQALRRRIEINRGLGKNRNS